MLLLVITTILAAEAASYGVIGAFIDVSAFIASITAIVLIDSWEAASGAMLVALLGPS